MQRNVVFLFPAESGSHYGPSFQNLIYSFIHLHLKLLNRFFCQYYEGGSEMNRGAN